MKLTPFERGDRVIHRKTGGIYIIVYGPADQCRLEATNEPAYMYKGGGGVLWMCCATEMEDGRFLKLPHKGLDSDA